MKQERERSGEWKQGESRGGRRVGSGERARVGKGEAWGVEKG